MAILTRAAFAVALLMSFGCQRSPTSIDVARGNISVHAVLVAGSDSVTVLVTRPVTAVDELPPGLTQPVENAQVLVVHGADTVVAASGARACLRTTRPYPFPGGSSHGDTLSAGCYAARLPGGVRAGETYALIVNVPGEKSIRGTTRVPFPPQILEPAASSEPPVLRIGMGATALTARWSGAGADTRTELRFVTDRSDCVTFVEQRPWSDHVVAGIGADSATVMAMSIQCDQPPTDRYAARLVVTVYDDSYSRYATRDDESIPSFSAGITGAFGVFGAAANSATPVVLAAQ
jgi:hypothetical protein